ncbi:2-phospho-L-lactate guanylyltransferase [Jatrophihabitans endophyticus]|uniref:Phosphoenolpyruvate guanylyltransferase n=1 Tax=Jatrophihabitans endophyticus TaxID=1206085 RepID=A0A1M5D463_9ACTN|nr:2-phospho-L-lactate guanylyltransferase [Jatrophihabitans endophyticus]SHF61774.1 2-phospho-L-lactate guanylyltransferase [Jatrophihabitans endophyticus]
MRWTVVIPAKSLPAAKSRLAPMSVDAAAHRRLVEAIRADTVAAAAAADGVARVLLVTDRDVTAAAGAPDRPGGVGERLVQTRPGLNGAVRDAAEHAAERWPDDGLAVLVGDLPALRPEELAEVLATAGAGTGFVPDADGVGTTLLTAAPGHPLRPEFGGGSAARHARHARPLVAGPGLRRDVDTAADLRGAATDLGVGPATAAVLDATDTTAAGTTAGPVSTDTDVTVRSTCLGMIGE